MQTIPVSVPYVVYKHDETILFGYHHKKDIVIPAGTGKRNLEDISSLEMAIRELREEIPQLSAASLYHPSLTQETASIFRKARIIADERKIDRIVKKSPNLKGLRMLLYEKYEKEREKNFFFDIIKEYPDFSFKKIPYELKGKKYLLNLFLVEAVNENKEEIEPIKDEYSYFEWIPYNRLIEKEPYMNLGPLCKKRIESHFADGAVEAIKFYREIKSYEGFVQGLWISHVEEDMRKITKIQPGW